MAGEGEEYGDGKAWIRASLIGEGTFGRVYVATLRNPSSRNCFFPPVMAVKSAEVSDSGSIQKEREVYANLGYCPYIIQCYGEEITTGCSGRMAFNLMLEYGSGGTLAERIGKFEGKGLAEVEVRMHTRSILRGLKHIHEVGYVHCDLKPDNILLCERRRGGGFRAKIADLGLAKKVKQSRKRKLGLGFGWEGTPMYLSPEAVVQNVQEAASDVWAIGCIVIEMLTGKSPLEGKMKEMGALEVLKNIGEGVERVEIPNELSKEAKAFLKGCFVRNTDFRLTCEMLLQHQFLDGLEEDEDEDDDDDDDDDDETEYSSEEECFSSSSSCEEVDVTEDDEFVVSNFGGERDEEIRRKRMRISASGPLTERDGGSTYVENSKIRRS